MDANSSFDPTATLSPDDPLQAWLQDPAMADFVKQKALEHAQTTLGFSDPSGNNIDPNSGMPTSPYGTPITINPSGVRPASESVSENNPNGLPYGPPAPTLANALDPADDSLVNPNPVEKGTVPLPTANPTKNTDVSARKKDVGDATSDFAKTLAGLKPTPPPPLNAVGTPSVRSPGAVSAPQLAQLLSLLGAQSRPDPVQTLGRLLVAGKA